MPVIVVANPKGGVGEITLPSNIASYLASRGHAVILGDADRQQSARTWLSLCARPGCHASLSGRSAMTMWCARPRASPILGTQSK